MKLDQIIKNPLFKGIEKEALDRLLGCLQAYEKQYQKGEYILHRGDVVSHIGYMVEGTAHIIKDDYWGNRTIIREIETEDLFAEAYACIPEQPSEISILTTRACNILFLDIHHLMQQCEQTCHYHQRIIQNLLIISAQKNIALTQKMEHITKRTTRDKILSYLSALSLQTNQLVIEVPFNRQQLADYLSVDRSALSAELSKMQKEGIILYHKHTFQLR